MPASARTSWLVLALITVSCRDKRTALPVPSMREPVHLSATTTYGGANAFKSVNSVQFPGGGRVAVLDPASHRVSLFDSTGALLSSYGGKGSGRGQMMIARGLSRLPDGRLLMVDRVRKVMSVLEVSSDAIHLHDEVPLPLKPGDLCTVGSRIFVSGQRTPTDSLALHELTIEGTIKRSFGEIVPSEGGEQFSAMERSGAALGDIACSESAIALAALYYPRLRFFSPDGSPIGSMTIPGYDEEYFEVVVDPLEPPVRRVGAYNSAASIHWLRAGLLLVQYKHYTDWRTPPQVVTQNFDLRTSWGAEPDRLPLVVGVYDNEIYATTVGTLKSLTRFRYGR
jgi:hypothetical protein